MLAGSRPRRSTMCVAFRKQEEKEIDCPFYVREEENTVLYQPYTHTHTKTCSHTQNSPSSSRELQPKAKRKYSMRVAPYSFPSVCSFCCCPDKNSVEKAEREKKLFVFFPWKSFERISVHSLFHPLFFFSFNWFREKKEAISHIEPVRWAVLLWADVFFIHAGRCKIAARSIIDSIGPWGPLTGDQ